MRVTESPCRACGRDTLHSVLDFGPLQLSDFPPGGSTPQRPAPLDLTRCAACGLVQLRHTVEPDALFRRYWYQSGINETMRTELQSIVTQAVGRVPVTAGDVVLDIGANDGTLLAGYAGLRHPPFRVAVEPAGNLQGALQAHCEDRWPCYFPDPVLVDTYRGRVRILTSIACFYASNTPHAFAAAVRALLAPGGVWIVQFQDLQQMLQATAFDNICHEHLIYYSLRSFTNLVTLYGLQVVRVERRTINGGSLRITVQRGDAPATAPDGVVAQAAAEWGCEHTTLLAAFAQRVWTRRSQVRALVQTAQQQQQTIDLYGASTKANMLLQVCELGPPAIRQAWERSETKWGCTTITGIPIVSEAVGRAQPPAVLLAGIWQFREAILQREAAYLAQGGALLFPLPVVDVVRAEEAEEATC